MGIRSVGFSLRGFDLARTKTRKLKLALLCVANCGRKLFPRLFHFHVIADENFLARRR